MRLRPSFFNHDAQAGGFYPQSHVGIDIENFDQGQNILIEGIRGTGKTHVLKMLESHCVDNFSSRRVLPVFVSLAQISEHAKKNQNEFRLHLYTHIVQNCINKIHKHIGLFAPGRNLPRRAINSLLNLLGLSSSYSIDDAFFEISSTAEILRHRLEYDLTTETIKRLASHSQSVGSEDATLLGTSLSPIRIEARSERSLSSQSLSQKELAANFIGSRLAHKNAQRYLVEFLQHVQAVLDLEYVLLLIDECSEASRDAQVEIFRLFKTIRGAQSLVPGRDSCAFFIGSVYPKGQTYYPNRNDDGFSFEPGQDCTVEFLQWDETDVDSYMSFFREMTLKRARQFVEKESDILLDIESELFEEPEAFYLAAYCAHGIPRRYWEILKRAYDRPSSKVLTSGVSYAVQEIADNYLLSYGDLRKHDINLINEILDRLMSKNIDIRYKNNKGNYLSNPIPQTIYISVAREVLHLLNMLTMKGVVHNKARMRTKSKKKIQSIFALDLSIAYTFRVVPQKFFVSTIDRDLPRIVANGFDQALELKGPAKTDYIKKFSKEDAKSIEDKYTNVVSKLNRQAQSREKITEVQYKGVIRFTNPSFGFIKSESFDQDIYFESSNIKVACRSQINSKSVVEFRIKKRGSMYEASCIWI
ncbi:MAG: hypothetical protein RhofKO_37200 [Rhodothermales bacterium]